MQKASTATKGWNRHAKYAKVCTPYYADEEVGISRTFYAIVHWPPGSLLSAGPGPGPDGSFYLKLQR